MNVVIYFMMRTINFFPYARLPAARGKIIPWLFLDLIATLPMDLYKVWFYVLCKMLNSGKSMVINAMPNANVWSMCILELYKFEY